MGPARQTREDLGNLRRVLALVLLATVRLPSRNLGARLAMDAKFMRWKDQQ